MTSHRERWNLPRRVAFIFIPLASIMAFATGPCSAAPPSAATAKSEISTNWTPVINQDFPDPTVLDDDGNYYAYSTEVESDHVPELETSDFTNWGPDVGGAMPTVPSWADQPDEFESWAPSVAKNPAGQFVMYFSAADNLVTTYNGIATHCIGEALSTTPAGPFVDNNPNPLICDGELGGDIDPSIFQDPSTGYEYLIWKIDGTSIGKVNSLWAEPLNKDLSLTGQAPTELLSADQTWQDGNIEGPAMADISGHYYLFYSGNNYKSSSYAVGLATCSSPLGPCEDGSNNPVIASGMGMSGPGGPSFFTTLNGQLMLTFSAWPGVIGYTNGGYRAMYLAAVTFTRGHLSFRMVTPNTPNPIVSLVSPTSGPIAGGTTVSVNGAHFTGAIGVSFGADPATKFTVDSDTKISATSPSHLATVADITVSTPEGSSLPTSNDRFTFDASMSAPSTPLPPIPLPPIPIFVVRLATRLK